MTLKVGLTGGIGSGKSAAAERFGELGAEVIDTDRISRELVEPGQPALAEIVAAFGDDVVDADGRLDRTALRARVFADARLRRRLESILHPRIRDEMLARAARSRRPYAVLVVPLLIETGQHALVDRVLLIDVPEALQRRRVAARDSLDRAQLDAVLRAQSSRAARRALADDIILNDRDLAALRDAVDRLHGRYLALAGPAGDH